MITAEEFNRLIGVHVKDGWRAARKGKALADNPWKADTVGGKAWSLGWLAGDIVNGVKS